MFCLLTAYQKAGNERIAIENKQKFSPILTQIATTLDMDFMIMPPFLQENSIQGHNGQILLWEIGLLFMIIVLLENSCLKPGIENAAFSTASQ